MVWTLVHYRFGSPNELLFIIILYSTESPAGSEQNITQKEGFHWLMIVINIEALIVTTKLFDCFPLFSNFGLKDYRTEFTSTFYGNSPTIMFI